MVRYCQRIFESAWLGPTKTARFSVVPLKGEKEKWQGCILQNM